MQIYRYIDNLGNNKRVDNTLMFVVRQDREREFEGGRSLHVGCVITVIQPDQAERRSSLSAMSLEPISMHCCSWPQVQVRNGQNLLFVERDFAAVGF